MVMLLHHFVVARASPGCTKSLPLPSKSASKLRRRAPDVIQRDVRKLRHLHDAGEGMETPEREDVEAVTRHVVEELAPEVHAPHFRDVRLRRVGGVGVARRAQIERDVELDAALRDVRRVVGVLQRVERARANRLRDVQPAIHRAGGISPAHRDGAVCVVVLHADAVTLRNGFGVLSGR